MFGKRDKKPVTPPATFELPAGEGGPKESTSTEERSSQSADFGAVDSNGRKYVEWDPTGATDMRASSLTSDESRLRTGLMQRALRWLEILEKEEGEDYEGKKTDLQTQVEMFKVLKDWLIANWRTKGKDGQDDEGVPGVDALMAIINGAIDTRLDKKIDEKEILVAPKPGLRGKPPAQERVRRERIERAKSLVKDVNPHNAKTFSNADDSELAQLVQRGRESLGIEDDEPEDED